MTLPLTRAAHARLPEERPSAPLVAPAVSVPIWYGETAGAARAVCGASLMVEVLGAFCSARYLRAWSRLSRAPPRSTRAPPARGDARPATMRVLLVMMRNESSSPETRRLEFNTPFTWAVRTYLFMPSPLIPTHA